MTRGVRLYLVGSFVLVSLAGCGRGFFQSAEREPWRAEAEIACLKSGAVKENADLVRIDPISGPGVCGAEFPLKVAALGESNSSFGFADDDLRPPGGIGNQPRWPTRSRRRPDALTIPIPPRQPGYRLAVRRPVSLTAPGCRAGRGRDRSAARGRAGVAGRPVGVSLIRRGAIRRATAIRTVLRAPVCRSRLPRLGPGRGQFGRRVRTGRGQADGDAGLSDRLGAGSLAGRFRAAGRDALVRRARGRDQADLRLFLPRHERQFARAYFRTRVRQCAGYRRVHAGRRPAHLGQGRLEGHAGRAGLSARRAGVGLPASSPPCWRRAPTSITTITSMST